jgi:major membrane immunogen (membrane-anchored lipoprotein)
LFKQLDGIDSIKPSKDFLTVTLDNGKKHRLKGDFYHEKFEIGSYSEHLRAAAESEQLQTSLQQLSQTLINFEQLIEQSEKPIIKAPRFCTTYSRRQQP